MNLRTLIAIALVVFGIVVLAYSGITFRTPGKPIDFLGLHIATTNSHFVPPVVGVICLASGVLLFFLRPRSS